MTQLNKTETRAVLLAAGQGKRMKSALPKVLHEILGKPIISRMLESLDKLGFAHVYIVVGHCANQVVDYLKKHPPKTPWSVHVQEPQLGSGHALMQVADELKAFTGTCIVIPGDQPLIESSNLSSLLEKHQSKNAAITVLSTHVEDPKAYGRIIRKADGSIAKIVENKDLTDEQKQIKEVNTAMYCLDWASVSIGLSSLKPNNKNSEYYLTDLIGWAVDNKLVVLCECLTNWKEVSGINSRQELAEVSLILKDMVLNKLMNDSGVTVLDPQSTWIAPEVKIGADTTVYPGCMIFGEVEIGSGCVIGPHTTIYGPAKIGAHSTVMQTRVINSVIGSDCIVGPFAHLRDGAVISEAARIGNFVEIKNSNIGKESKVSHLSYIGDTKMGEGVNIGAGTITANYDSLSKKKSTTVIGNSASTGCNSVLIAPVEIGQDAVIAAGSVITKNVPPGTLAVSRSRQENKDGWTQRKKASLPKHQTESK